MRLPKYTEIVPYIEKGLVSMQRHPNFPSYRIFNYTQHCQFEGAWDDVTRQCRGLILDLAATGDRVVARPFPKFFNYGEHLAKNLAIPEGEEPMVYEKLDGSLGILYSAGDKPWIATRGSFTSDQAKWATDWFRKNVTQEYFETNVTHLFEIIYPANRIVVNYDFSGLVYLGTIENGNGMSLSCVFNPPVRSAKVFRNKTLKELAALDESNSEGFVVFYPRANVRMKLKFPEYVRLHKLITGVSEIAIWEHLRDGNDLNDLLEKVPDEFFKWVGQVQNALWEKFILIEKSARNAVKLTKKTQTRKEQAACIMRNTTHPSVAFAMLDEKDYKQIIWKMIRPVGQSLYKVDIDA